MALEEDDKINQIVTTIENSISKINERYGTGPDFYFYTKVIGLRNSSESVESFLSKDYHLEILYATLAAWGMNSRNASMKDFEGFKDNILSCLGHFKQLESFYKNIDMYSNELKPYLKNTYDDLKLMKSKGKLISNSKLLHFLFPRMLMPMDTNTLNFFYGNAGESVDNYIEIIGLSHKIMHMPKKWEEYLDKQWNPTVPKMIDNAIFLKVKPRE